jgi:transcription elongation GreA/GreB family factor
MGISRTTRKLIEGGNVEGVEDEWLGHLAEQPEDLDYFVATARSLAASGHEPATRQLLELLDEHLSAEGLWVTRLSLLERTEVLLFAGETLHGEILASIKELYPDSRIRDALIEKVGLHRAVHDTKKTWKKVARLRDLMQFRRGTVVWMDGKGAGIVEDVNIELEKYRVALDNSTVTVGFGAAAKVLRPLPNDSFHARKIREPEELRALAESQPDEILRLCLEGEDEPVSSSFIRQAVTGIIPSGSWPSWWDAARANPRLVTTGKGARQRYGWATSRGEASAAARAQFDEADLEHKLAIYRREAKKDPARETEMRSTLLELARSPSAKEAEALLIGMTLEQGAASDLGPAAPASVMACSNDPISLVAALEDKAARRRAAALLKETHEDWPQAFAALMLREDDPRLLSDLADAVSGADEERLVAVFDAIVAHPRRRPGAFVWLAENLASYPFLERRNPLRFMQLVLRAEGGREFAPFRSRLHKLIATSDTLPHLIADLSEEQVEQAEQMLARAPVEEYVRQPLINALHLRFPEIFQRSEDALYAMPGSIEARRAELKELLEVEIPANRRAIEEARELGDLRENFEYKSARQRHEYLSARATALDAELRRARAIDISQVDDGEVRIGCRVSLRAGDESRRIAILGPWESDPEAGVLSYESDTARRLLGKPPGGEAEIDGTVWRIEAIEPAEPGP